jgi:hypothetical protein
MIRDTIHEAQTAFKLMTNTALIAEERVRLKKQIVDLKKKNDWLGTQNDALRLEVGKMIGKAMIKHWDTVKDMRFELDGFKVKDQTFLATISPSLGRIDWLRLPWRTSFALLFRWTFMQLVPQSAFAPLIARATIGPTHAKAGVGVNKSPGIDSVSLEEMRKNAEMANLVNAQTAGTTLAQEMTDAVGELGRYREVPQPAKKKRSRAKK